MPLSVLPRGDIPSQSSAIRAVPSVSLSLSLLLSCDRRSLGIGELLLEGCSHDDNSRGMSLHRASIFFTHLTKHSFFFSLALFLPVYLIDLTRNNVFVLPPKEPVFDNGNKINE